MNDDLISKEKIIKKLRRMGNSYGNFIEKNIRDLPAEYNINRVLEQLKMNQCIVDNKWSIAEKIIRSGGIEN